MHPTMREYLAHREAAFGPYSLSRHAHDLLIFWRWAEAHRLDPLKATAEDLSAYQQHLADRHRTPKGEALSAASQVKRLSAVKTYYRFLARRGFVLLDVAKGLKLPKTPRHTTQRDYLSLQEATALLQTQARRVADTPKEQLTWAIEFRNLAFYSLAIATGRRFSGLRYMKVDDLDFKRDEIRVRLEKGKTGRVLPVARWAMVVLFEYLREARPRFRNAGRSGFLFVSKRNDKVSHQVGEALKELQRQTVSLNPDLTELPGKIITTHGLRVTFAKLLFNGGCNLRSVNELMLHNRLSTTAYYTPLNLEELRRACRTAHPRA